MRHFFLPGAISTHALGMGETSAATPLVASASLPYRSTADQLRTGSGTITLASVAVAANEYLRAAAPAQKETSHRFHRLAPVKPNRYRQERTFCGTISLHTCSARCGARHRASLAVYSGVVPVLFGTVIFTASCAVLSSPGARETLHHAAKNILNTECVHRNEQAFRYRGCNFENR